MQTLIKNLVVRSSAFGNGGHVPPKYTCNGENVNPPLEISDIPEETMSLAAIVEDPDAPGATFTHWLVWNLPPGEQIAEKTNEGISGMNDFGKTGYGGPCPPSGTHRYYFKIFALDKELHLATGESKASLLNEMT